MKYKIYLITLLFTFIACERNQDGIMGTKDTNSIIGYWINNGHEKDLNILERSNKFNKQKSGIQFKTDNNVVQYKNSSWCGTPPIHRSTFNGKWRKNDSILRITTKGLGGYTEQVWKILSIDNKELKYKIKKYKFHKKGFKYQ